MAEKYELKEFREALRKAIGPIRSQAEFASEAGITPEHLNRMLNLPQIGKPSMATLRKIAGHAFGGVTLAELASACGYESVKEEPALMELTPKARVDRFLLELEKGVCAVLEENNVFPSVFDFISEVVDHYTTEKPVIEIESPRDYEGRYPAENAAVVNYSMGDTLYSLEMANAVLYSETKKGKVIVLRVEADPQLLLRLKSKLAEQAMELSRTENAPFPTQNLILVHKRAVNAPKADFDGFKEKIAEIAANSGITPEEAMMNLLFGDKNKPKRPMSCEGTGFYTDTVNLSTVRKFLKAHKNSFVRSAKEAEIYQKFVEEGIDVGAFEGYENETGFAGAETWMTAVVNVIYRETDIRLDSWELEDDEPFQNRPSIMFTDRSVWLYNSTEKELSRESLTQIMDRYARELRCELAESCYYVMLSNVIEE